MVSPDLASLRWRGEPRLQARWFDGRSAQAQPIWAWLSEDGHGLLLQARLIDGGDEDGDTHAPQRAAAPVLARHATRQVVWPERLRHGERQALLPDGSVLCEDTVPEGRQRWDDWAQASGLRDSLTVRSMRSWRLVGLSVLLSAGLLASAWVWGIPWVAQTGAALIPNAVERQIASEALDHVDRMWLKPSTLSEARQEEITRRLAAAVRRDEILRVGLEPQATALPAYRLHFRAGPKALGPNAFALPGGDIVLTDALVELAEGEPDIITGVLAHELGHVRHRHGMRLVLQAGMVAGVSGLLVGDFSALLAGLPAWLAQADYSREFEREADLHARQMLQAAGISPRVMVRFFERLEAFQKQRGQDPSPLPMAFASHPAHAERIAFFNAAP